MAPDRAGSPGGANPACIPGAVRALSRPTARAIGSAAPNGSPRSTADVTDQSYMLPCRGRRRKYGVVSGAALSGMTVTVVC